VNAFVCTVRSAGGRRFFAQALDLGLGSRADADPRRRLAGSRQDLTGNIVA
jgi:hypothetical protein